MRRGVLIAESIHPNKAHIGGRGINMLTGAEAVAPVGGAAFHDNKVWVKKVTSATARKSLDPRLQSTVILPQMLAAFGKRVSGTMTDTNSVIREKRGQAFWITINRPDKRNAINADVDRRHRARLSRSA